MKKTFALIIIMSLMIAGVAAAQRGLPDVSQTIQQVHSLQSGKRGVDYIQILSIPTATPVPATRGMRAMSVETMDTMDTKTMETTLTSPIDAPSEAELVAPEGVDMSVNVYSSPEGDGYDITADYEDESGQNWRTVDQAGPEAERASDWEPLPTPLSVQESYFTSPLATPEVD